MHIPTHIMSGWVIANCVPLTPRERLACMIIATVPDIDGPSVATSTIAGTTLPAMGCRSDCSRQSRSCWSSRVEGRVGSQWGLCY